MFFTDARNQKDKKDKKQEMDRKIREKVKERNNNDLFVTTICYTVSNVRNESSATINIFGGWYLKSHGIGVKTTFRCHKYDNIIYVIL